jgi:cell division protease FtsH
MDYSHSKNYSETYATQIDDEIKRILTECYDKCENILTVHNDKLVLIAETLIKNEKITGARFQQLMAEDYDPANDVEEEETIAPESTEASEAVATEEKVEEAVIEEAPSDEIKE